MIEKAIQLYEMMAARFEKTGWSPSQAAVYAEIAEFMRNECATIDEATEKLKHSPLFLAPSVALMKDKINAYIRAAEDDKVRGVAEVYRQKLEEIERDPATMHDPAYFTAAQNLYIKYYAPIEAFKEIYNNYLQLEGNYDFTTHRYAGGQFETLFLPFRMAFEQFERYENNLAECSHRPEFREVIPVSDASYKRFVNDALRYRSNPSDADPVTAYNAAEKRVEAIWSHLNGEQITEKIKNYAGVERGACLMVAPPDEHGDYEYTEVITIKI
ncbi:MAG: hypothetical protein FWF09_04750 [Bacteroidales bacterium]|nr:hypothetical protein [Bacteroidales bacterium]